MTPVPKCFPMKKTNGGIRNIGICLDKVGNDAAEMRFIRVIHIQGKTMNQPKSEAKKMINITSRRGSSAEFTMITAADSGEWKAMLETTVGIIRTEILCGDGP